MAISLEKYQRKPLLNSGVVGGRADNEGVIASVLTGLQTVKEWHSKWVCVDSKKKKKNGVLFVNAFYVLTILFLK